MESKKVSRRGFLGIAVAAVVAGVVAGVGGYYAGMLSAPPAGAPVTVTTTVPGGTSTVTQTMTSTVTNTVTKTTTTQPPPITGKEILIGNDRPMTGGLAAFGAPGKWAAEAAAADINAAGGVYVKELGGNVPIRIITVDNESDPNKAATLATQLALDDKVHFIFAYNPPGGFSIPAVLEKYAVPNHTWVPIEPWAAGGPYKYGWNSFWTIATVLDKWFKSTDSLASQTNKKVALFSANDVDSATWDQMYNELLKEKGYTPIDYGVFPPGTPDFTSYIQGWKNEKCEILWAQCLIPDLITVWRQGHEQGWVPKLAVVGGKTIEFQDQIVALGGDLGQGLMVEIWASHLYPFKMQIAGKLVGCGDLADRYFAETGKPPAPELNLSYSGVKMVADSVERAGTLDREAINKAFGEFQGETLGGNIKFDLNTHVAPTPLTMGQWQKGGKYGWDLQVVWSDDPEIKPTAPLIFPLPGSTF